MNRTTVVCAVLILAGTPVAGRATKPATESEMKDMRLVEGGTFEMGDVFNEHVQLATPVHEVTVSAFCLNKYEVTVEEFAAFVKDTGYVTLAERSDNREPVPGKIAMPRMQAQYDARLAGGDAIILDPVAQETSRGLTANWRNPFYEQRP